MRLKDDPQPRIQTACLLVLVAVCITFSVYWLRPVLVPLVVAFFVVSGVSPVLSVLEKRLGVTRSNSLSAKCSGSQLSVAVDCKKTLPLTKISGLMVVKTCRYWCKIQP